MKSIIKKLPLDIAAYSHKLANWIKENQSIYFDNNRATAWQDFDYWPDVKTCRRELIMPDEYLLIDRDFEGEHWYVICKISKSKEKNYCRHIYPVIKISELNSSHWKNGYFLLPNLD